MSLVRPGAANDVELVLGDEKPINVRPAELVNRLDYREVPTFTIDPDDAKDVDDALSVLDDGLHPIACTNLR